MDLKETLKSNMDKVKAAMDADGDGKVTAAEAFGAVGGRIDDAVAGAVEFVSQIKGALDADADGKVTSEEVSDVAKGAAAVFSGAAEEAAGSVKTAIDGFLKKGAGVVEAEADEIEEVVEAEFEEIIE